MIRVLDFRRKVADLAKEYPDFIEIMADLGFKEITSPTALKLMGKVMTVPKGAAVKGIPLERIVDRFEEAGFRVTGLPESFSKKQGNGKAAVNQNVADIQKTHCAGQVLEEVQGAGETDDREKTAGNQEREEDKTEAEDEYLARLRRAEEATVTGQERVSLLKDYIARVGQGEELESVRRDFIENFESVSVHEIAEAEQSLINDGMDPAEVQKLCDLHSALFHGKTEAEVWAEEEAKSAEAGYKIPQGHPVDYFHRENAALEKKLKRAKLDLGFGTDLRRIQEELADLKRVRTLYGKKEESIMPPLERYGISGPSNVMWGVDDEIKAELGRLTSSMATALENDRAQAMFDAIKEDIAAVYQRMEEMIYKEEKILLPMAMEHFTREEWLLVYEDLFEMGPVFIDSIPHWEEGDRLLEEKRAAARASIDSEGMITFEQGKMSLAQLQAMFDLLPIDITFIDADDVNQFFSNQGKVFARPRSALGRKVYDCHPVRIRPVVEQLISEFKEGSRDSYERWIPNPLKPVKIQYLAVRDREGKFLGTLELVQDFTKIKKELRHFR